MRYHKAHLTRRLILDTSADSEKEENMVEWLREVGMPADYVNKLARMFQDIKVSQDLNQQFKEECRAAIADSINIKVSLQVDSDIAIQISYYTPLIILRKFTDNH